MIPAFCEAPNISATLRSVFDCPKPPEEVIVVDGGSTDGTAQIARRAGAKVISAPKGRGAQLNAGWRCARGDWVLFLHADSQLPPNYSGLVDQQLQQQVVQLQKQQPQPCRCKQLYQPLRQRGDPEKPGLWPRWLTGGRNGGSTSSGDICCIGGKGTGSSSEGSGRNRCSHRCEDPCREPSWGCFSSIRATELSPLLAGLLQFGVALRTQALWRPYGDQALFVRRPCLERMQGFKEWPLLEDLEMVQRLAKRCAPVIVPAHVTTAGRRWSRFGFWRTYFTNQLVLVGYAAGIDVRRLAELYRCGGSVDVGRKPGS